LQGLAKIRMKEAEALSHSGLHDGAYYLAGYAVECALKACIAKTTVRHEFPDRVRANACHTHDLWELVKEADLEKPLLERRRADALFDEHWTNVRLWSERSRYRLTKEAAATNLVRGVADRKHGILSWLKAYW
jgi:HEPN domain-containing protein